MVWIFLPARTSLQNYTSVNWVQSNCCTISNPQCGVHTQIQLSFLVDEVTALKRHKRKMLLVTCVCQQQDKKKKQPKFFSFLISFNRFWTSWHLFSWNKKGLQYWTHTVYKNTTTNAKSNEMLWHCSNLLWFLTPLSCALLSVLQSLMPPAAHIVCESVSIWPNWNEHLS